MRMFEPISKRQASNLFAVIRYLQEYEGFICKSKPGRLPKVLCISVQLAIFFEQFEGFSEHGIFHGIAV
jgi:hypothetical protein